MEKINIAEVLKNCPSGMELDCTTWENVTFEKVVNDEIYIKRNNKSPSFDKIVILNKYGCCTNHQDEKCRIFPKGKTTWEGFVPPCKFKDGDVIYNRGIKAIAIYNEQNDDATISHCFLNMLGQFKICHRHSKDLSDWGLATEEEKQKLFDVIKENGYKWNPERKSLEKIVSKFKDGDILSVSRLDEEDNKRYQYIFILDTSNKYGKWQSYCHLTNNGYFRHEKAWLVYDEYQPRFATEEEKQKLFQAIKDNGYKWNAETKTLETLVKPTFKVGDRIRSRKNCGIPISNVIITEVSRCGYHGVIGDTTNKAYIGFKYQDCYELMPNKFDINTLKTFDQVLVRLTNNCVWTPKLFSYYDADSKTKYYPFVTTDNIGYPQCIPYNGNEHLCRTTDDCDIFYKTWK